MEAFDKAPDRERAGRRLVLHPADRNDLERPALRLLFRPGDPLLRSRSDGVAQKAASAWCAAQRTVRGARDVRAEQIAGFNVLTVRADRMAIGASRLRRKSGARYGRRAGRHPSRRNRRGRDALSDPRAPRPACAREPSQHRRLARAHARAARVVPLGHLAQIDATPGPRRSAAQRLQRRVDGAAQRARRDIGTFVQEAKALLDRIGEAARRLLHGVGRRVRALTERDAATGGRHPDLARDDLGAPGGDLRARWGRRS